jgi:hypothetical protein
MFDDLLALKEILMKLKTCKRMQAPTPNQPVLRYRGGHESQVYLLNLPPQLY